MLPGIAWGVVARLCVAKLVQIPRSAVFFADTGAIPASGLVTVQE
jgi:hypothetical protein